MNIVLLEPEIPHNTGAIGRTCFAVSAALHLIKPLGFSTDEKHLRRTGLDYWHTLNITYHDSLADFMEYFGRQNGPNLWLTDSSAKLNYTQAKFKPGDYLMFGNESGGIPEFLLLSDVKKSLRIPMDGPARCLNLSVAVGIVLYEALRQNDFLGLD